MTTIPFIHLHVQSDYSLGQSNIKITQLLEQCDLYRMPAVALTDSMNLFGAVEFAQKSVMHGIQPIIGSLVNVTTHHTTRSIVEDCTKIEHGNKRRAEHRSYIMLLLAKSEIGYKNLMKLVSYPYIYTTNVHTTCPSVPLEQVLHHSSGLIALIGESSQFGDLITTRRIEEAEKVLLELHEHFRDNLFIELTRYADDNQHRMAHSFIKHAVRMAYMHGIPIVATNPVQYLSPATQESHDILLCIANGRYISEPDRPRSHQDCYFKTDKEMRALFTDLPEAIDNTALIAQKCSYIIKTHSPMLPNFGSTDSGDAKCDEHVILTNNAKLGLNRYLSANGATVAASGHNEQDYHARLAYELEVIESMGFAGYFLIVSDFIRWSKQNGIPVGPGRGSGAGSLVALALEITAVDPIRFGLLFERFLNPDRISMPDFDIDFCQTRRDEVIKYVREKYGSSRVSHIITFGKLQARAVLRDVGRVLQMPYNMVDKISKMVPHNPANPITLQEAIDLDKEMQYQRDTDPDVARLLRISLQLEGVSRHTSTHAAGVLIAACDTVEIAPLYREEEDTLLPVVQYSMKYAEAVGLIKFDFLGLKTLTVLQSACNFISQEHGININLNQLPLDDNKTYKMLSAGKTIGVFQFEGYGMRESIKNLKPDRIEDLVALSSLYRPGPMENIPLYIRRKHGLEEVTHIHDKLATILEETYGIIVYQEQVMQIAQTLAGYSLAEADLLRRAMGKKDKTEMQKQQSIFINNAIALGTSEKSARDIFELMEKFASYGFNKSHAVAYSIISYQTAYLKAHYTIEFLTASMNLEIDDSGKIHTFCTEAKNFGIGVLRPSINKSDVYFSIEHDTQSTKCSIRFGLLGIKSIGMRIAQEIAAERKKNGDYKSIFDMVQRTISLGLNKRTLEVLAKSGALEDIHQNTAQIILNIDNLLQNARLHITPQTSGKQAQQASLFGSATMYGMTSTTPLQHAQNFSQQKKLEAEYEALGFHITAHPISEYKSYLRVKKAVPMKVVEHIATNRVKIINIAGLIISKKIRSGKKGKFAFIQLSDDSGVIDASIFDQDLLCKASDILHDGSLVFCRASAIKDSRGLRIIIEDIKNITDVLSNMHSKYVIYVYNNDKDAIDLIRELCKNVMAHDSIDNACATGEKLILLHSVKVVLVEKNGGSVYCSFDYEKNAQIQEDALFALNNSPNIEVVEEYD